jgi:branched-chain amino acid transport system permease protein
VPERFWPAALVAALGVALLSAIIERLFMRQLYGKEQLYRLILTYARVLIIGDAVKCLWARSSFWCPPAGAGWRLRGVQRDYPRLQPFIVLFSPGIAK